MVGMNFLQIIQLSLTSKLGKGEKTLICYVPLRAHMSFPGEHIHKYLEAQVLVNPLRDYACPEKVWVC